MTHKTHQKGQIQAPGQPPQNITFISESIPVQTLAEASADVYPVNPEYDEGDIRRYGAVDDANINGSSGTDSTVAIQTSLDIPGLPTLIPSGNYLFSNLTIQASKAMIGEGIHESNLICKSGSTGTMFTDEGSAAKITVKDVAFYGNDCSYTGGFDLGNGVTQVYGTEGNIDNVWVRDLPANFPGIYIRGNVGAVGRVISWLTGGVAIVGPAMQVSKIVNLGGKGFTESDTSSVTTGTELGDGEYTAVEVEGPATNTIPLYIGKKASIGSLTMSLAASTTHSHLVEISANSSTWKVGNFDLIFASGTGATITNGNFYDAAETRYFGGNASSKNQAGEGNYASSLRLGGDVLEVKSQQLQAFTFRITKTAGTVQHRIGQTGASSSASNFHAKINAASSTLGDTPTGADASTAMATGCKIGSASTNVVHFDTASQLAVDALFFASITFNSTGTAYSVVPQTTSSIDINGTSRSRFSLVLTDATSGASVAWATAVGTNGWVIDVQIMAYLA